MRHSESYGRPEHYHRSVDEEAFGHGKVESLHMARALLGQWRRYYNQELLHSALNYLYPVDYYKGNSEALLAKWERKLKAAAGRRKEMNRPIQLTETTIRV